MVRHEYLSSVGESWRPKEFVSLWRGATRGVPLWNGSAPLSSLITLRPASMMRKAIPSSSVGL